MRYQSAEVIKEVPGPETLTDVLCFRYRSPTGWVPAADSMCVSLKIRMLKSESSCDGIRRWGLGEVI